MTAGEVELRPLAEAVGAAEQVIDDYVRAGAAAWGENPVALASTVEPLRGAIRRGRAPGCVACQGERGLGLVVYMERLDRQGHAAQGSGRLTFVHLLSDYPEEDLPARLLGHVVTRLRAAGFRQITSQGSLLPRQEAIRQAYLGLGFQACERMIMSAALAESLPDCPLPPGYEPSAWDDIYLERTAQLFHDANRDTLDALIYPQFKTFEETHRMVQAVRDGGIGPFFEEASGIILRGRTLCGAIMLVRPDPGHGLVIVVAVSPAHQGRGVGRALLTRALASARQAGVRTVELTVTEGNRPAVALYRRLGFLTRRRMTAYVWEAT